MDSETPTSLIDEIIKTAARQGVSQKMLAAQSNLSEEGLSRMKKRGSARLDVIDRLARAAGLRVVALPEEMLVRMSSGQPADRPRESSGGERRQRFRDKHPELVWSNSQASDEIFIRRALLDPRFATLLDAAREFGVEKLEREWRALNAEDAAEVRRVGPATTRILRNLRRGYEQASR